jgi:hypothetical protein
VAFEPKRDGFRATVRSGEGFEIRSRRGWRGSPRASSLGFGSPEFPERDNTRLVLALLATNDSRLVRVDDHCLATVNHDPVAVAKSFGAESRAGYCRCSAVIQSTCYLHSV